MIQPSRGDIWWADSPAFGHRPVVVLSRNESIGRLHHVLVAPVTRTIRGIPTEVVVEPGDDPVPYPSAVNLDSVGELPVGYMTEYLGRVSDVRMHQICEALKVAVGCR